MKLGVVGGILGCILFLAACGSSPATKTPAPSQPTTLGAATSVPVTAPAMSAAGSKLSADAKDTVIVLTWTPVGGASGYFVYRDASPTPLNAKPLTGTTYQDIGLTNGRTYTYTVAPVGPDGKAGSPSAPVTAVPKSG
jgi:hypothetical protein